MFVTKNKCRAILRSWFLFVLDFLQLPADQLYTTAISNIINENMQAEKGQEAASIGSGKNNFKFEKIQGLLGSISNTEMAIGAAKWVAKVLPIGKRDFF